MLNKRPGNSFLIVVLIVILGITSIRHPDIKAKFFSSYRQALFNQLQSELAANEFNPEHYWQFRERFSPGSFITDQTNTDFLSTFKITRVNEEPTSLLFYHSKYLNSVDGLLKGPFSRIAEQIKQNYPGEILLENDQLTLIKIDNNNYILAFAEPIELMKKVNGFFDYKSDEEELIQDRLWYNISKIQL